MIAWPPHYRFKVGCPVEQALALSAERRSGELAVKGRRSGGSYLTLGRSRSIAVIGGIVFKQKAPLAACPEDGSPPA